MDETNIQQQSFPSYKISINSHVNYSHALTCLLDSIDKYGFPRKELIITIGGRSNEPPELVETDPDREVTIYVPKNCYDLSHAYAIHHFSEHPRVKADYYVCIPDTSVITETFAARVKDFVKAMHEKNVDVLHALKEKRFCLVGLSYQFMKEHGHHYNKDIDKPTAWKAEHGEYMSYSSFVPSEKVAALDCPFSYGAGQPLYSDLIRHPIHVESMGLIKFVCNDTVDVNPPWQERQRP